MYIVMGKHILISRSIKMQEKRALELRRHAILILLAFLLFPFSVLPPICSLPNFMIFF